MQESVVGSSVSSWKTATETTIGTKALVAVQFCQTLFVRMAINKPRPRATSDESHHHDYLVGSYTGRLADESNPQIPPVAVCVWLADRYHQKSRSDSPISPPGRPADDDDNSIGVVVVLWGIERCTVHVISLQ